MLVRWTRYVPITSTFNVLRRLNDEAREKRLTSRVLVRILERRAHDAQLVALDNTSKDTQTKGPADGQTGSQGHIEAHDEGGRKHGKEEVQKGRVGRDKVLDANHGALGQADAVDRLVPVLLRRAALDEKEDGHGKDQGLAYEGEAPEEDRRV
jgi:hypothetical protein